MHQQPPTMRRYAEFEAYRGLAALLIVIFHAYQYTREGTKAPAYLYEGTGLHALLINLDTAVGWFFALSGFLLFLPLALAVMNGRSVAPARVYLFRRAVRVLPLYLLVIVLVWTWRYFGQPGAWIDLLEHLTFTHVWDSRYLFYTVGPAWSLGAEIIYYVMLALMGPLLYRVTIERPRADRVRWLLGFPLGLIIISVLYKYVTGFVLEINPDRFAWYFNPVAQVDSFAYGMLLASAVAFGAGNLSRGPRLWLLVAALGLTAFVFTERFDLPWVSLYSFSLAGLAFTLFLASTVLAQGAAWLTRALGHRFWFQLGMMSYGVYLWHEPLMLELSGRTWLIRPEPEAFLVNAVVLVLLSSLLATFTYWLVELPVMQARNLMTNEGRLRDDYAIERARDARGTPDAD